MAKRFGVMLDLSRNAVMRPSELKAYIKSLSDIGYNMVQLYTEDTYEVEGEPYFGYLRGRYSIAELQDIVAYASTVGVEVVPCIQTLAHLNCLFNWKKYSDINDCLDILLIDDERTYDLIDNMFRSLRKAYTTDVAHIGMDEAHMLGLGKYLDKHGYKNRFELLSRHLSRVIEIGKKHGFKCIMWSDMFFRLANEGVYYDWNHITDEVIAACPEDIGLVYWDYYHDDKSCYDGMLDAHKRFGRDVWFGGGAWTWRGLAPFSSFTMNSMEKAMDSCRERGIENIMFTMWGDNGRECSPYSILPALFHLRRYYDGVTDTELIKREFKERTGEEFSAMMDLELPNMVAGNNPLSPSNPSKAMFLSDPLFGFIDPIVKEGVGPEFAAHRAKLLEDANNSARFGYLFRTNAQLCHVMELKYDIGVRARKAYKAGDRETLISLVGDFTECAKRVEDLLLAFSYQWHKENKPHGFEVVEARYGGVAARLKGCARRLSSYLAGEIDVLEELEEELLPYDSTIDRSITTNPIPWTPGVPATSYHIYTYTVNRTY